MKISLTMTDEQKLAKRLSKLCRAKMQSAPIQAAKYLHRSVRNAIRVSPSPSKPGKPPHTRSRQTLKNAVSSKVERTSAGTRILVGLGAELGTKESLANIAGLHEVGGSIAVSRPVFRAGKYGPIAEARNATPGRKQRGGYLGGRFVFARLSSEAMAARANSLVATAFPKTKAEYPARPFLAPALEKARNAPGFLRIFSLK